MSLKCLHAGHVWSFCSFFIPPLFFYALENELLLGKELLLRMAFISFNPHHFFGVRTKKVKGASCHHPPHEKVDPFGFHAVNSLLRASWKQCCEGENKDLVSKRNSPSGT